MEKNVGGIDRTVRLVVGSLLAIIGIAALAGWLGLGTVIGVLALVVGAVLLFTGVTQLCILNRLFGIDTFRG